jgi:NADH-ubiquinone oxidoreductase chain 5
MFIGLGTDFWGNSLFTLPSKQPVLESEWLSANIKMIPLFFSFTGAFLAFFHYIYSFDSLFTLKTSSMGKYIYTFLNRKWFFDKVYNDFIAQPVLQISYKHTYQNMDRGLLEFLGPNGIAILLYMSSINISVLSLGFIFRYLFTMFVALFILLFCIHQWSTVISVYSILLITVLAFSIIILSIKK